MTVGDPALWSTRRQVAALAAGELSSRELLATYVDRIGRLDGPINAVCTLDVERASAQAQAADAAHARGESMGPLHGIPITIKDAIATEGIRSTGGAVELAQHVPSADAPVVASLKAAGAIVFGKTNLPAWSGDLQTFNEMFGTTNNPWDVTRVPGGSSGGAAAAVAMGMTSFEIGTDIGGSVRVPSAFCGVCGHKPSFGVIPTYGYLDAVGGGNSESDVNVFGPIARTVGDLELVLGIVAGAGPADSSAWRLELPPPPAGDGRGVRVAAWLDDPALAVDTEVVDLLEAAADALAATGVSVDRARRPRLDVTETWIDGARLIGSATSVSDDEEPGLSHRDWLLIERRRQDARSRWAELFADVDVLLCPVTVLAPFPHQQDGTWYSRRIVVNGVDRPYAELMGWPALIGSAYLPSTVVPIGFTRGGLPVGIQVVAAYLRDRTALHVAAMFEQLCGGFVAPPAARQG